MISLSEKEYRATCIGGSDIYKISNFDNITAQKLFSSKINSTRDEDFDFDSLSITAGNLLEEPALDFYQKVTKKHITRNERIEHSRIKNFICSLDGFSDIPIECKIIGESTWERLKAKKSFNAQYLGMKLLIPSSYYMQIQAQMCVTNTTHGILLFNVLTEEEKENCLTLNITDIHQRPVEIARCNDIISEIETRVEYFLWCLKYKRKPTESEYQIKYKF